METDALSDTLSVVRDRIMQYQGQAIGEADTKQTLIVPLLKSLGWDVGNLAEVRLEYRLNSSDHPVDFALFIEDAPRLFLEAKALGKNLEDSKWATQVLT